MQEQIIKLALAHQNLRYFKFTFHQAKSSRPGYHHSGHQEYVFGLGQKNHWSTMDQVLPSSFGGQRTRTAFGTEMTSTPYTTGEGSGAKPCPQDWLLHRGKCYYFSKEGRNWSSSPEDCAEKGSDLLVIQDQEERNFIQDKTQNMHHWIGLYILSPRNSWTWVDGSPFISGKLFSLSESLEEGQVCGNVGQAL
ncbi:killer cell lectin-like receptor subfamily B member 1B allele C [Microcaecilia unicolor]|uniref:Killer cell lectin-like receptor subfamily B member 1B allele C n=1 Tax=Microcaecilia unicolor TaxID=1415580 RepID=A0A6P7WH82_9AMPH|nr:killer cell lectin-like receptor subfamily B member 1B allele C [Microcaecilia unicolor]